MFLHCRDWRKKVRRRRKGRRCGWGPGGGGEGGELSYRLNGTNYKSRAISAYYSSRNPGRDSLPGSATLGRGTREGGEEGGEAGVGSNVL